jgi:hypothetical protein
MLQFNGKCNIQIVEIYCREDPVWSPAANKQGQKYPSQDLCFDNTNKLTG